MKCSELPTGQLRMLMKIKTSFYQERNEFNISLENNCTNSNDNNNNDEDPESVQDFPSIHLNNAFK